MDNLKIDLRKHTNAELYEIRKGRVPDSVKAATINEILEERRHAKALLWRVAAAVLATLVAFAIKQWFGAP